jgi:hypothetical protein
MNDRSSRSHVYSSKSAWRITGKQEVELSKQVARDASIRAFDNSAEQ